MGEEFDWNNFLAHIGNVFDQGVLELENELISDPLHLRPLVDHHYIYWRPHIYMLRCFTNNLNDICHKSIADIIPVVAEMTHAMSKFHEKLYAGAPDHVKGFWMGKLAWLLKMKFQPIYQRLMRAPCRHPCRLQGLDRLQPFRFEVEQVLWNHPLQVWLHENRRIIPPLNVGMIHFSRFHNLFFY